MEVYVVYCEIDGVADVYKMKIFENIDSAVNSANRQLDAIINSADNPQKIEYIEDTIESGVRAHNKMYSMGYLATQFITKFNGKKHEVAMIITRKQIEY